MTTLARLTLDLFLLAHAHIAAGQAGDGFAFERRVRTHLQDHSLPHSLGFRVLGRHSLSGLYHQIDEQTACDQALVVGEWKAHTGQLPKNELMRFKAATDDYWLGQPGDSTIPVVRLFGGTGQASTKLLNYAGCWGIGLITPYLWPIPALCDPYLLWGYADLPGPTGAELRAMTTLIRPMGSLMKPQPDGSWQMPRLPSSSEVTGSVAVWQQWSDRAWHWWEDTRPARFDTLLTGRVDTEVA